MYYIICDETSREIQKPPQQFVGYRCAWYPLSNVSDCFDGRCKVEKETYVGRESKWPVKGETAWLVRKVKQSKKRLCLCGTNQIYKGMVREHMKKQKKGEDSYLTITEELNIVDWAE